MKNLISAAVAIALSMSSAIANEIEYGTDGENPCVEYDVGHMWMSTEWNKISVIKAGFHDETHWIRNNSNEVMTTYKTYVKTYHGQIMHMMCRVLG